MKRGISPVVATVLLILVTVMAIIIVANIVIPLVKNQINEGKICFDGREYFKVIDSEYTCYNSTNTKLMIKRGTKELDVEGVLVGIYSEGESETYSLVEGGEDIKMLKDGSFTSNIELPEIGEARTYLFDLGGKKVELALIHEDGKCDPETHNIPKC
jgi:flagellin-like protein